MESSFAPKQYLVRMLTKNSPSTTSEKSRDCVYTIFWQTPQSEWFREEP